MDNLYSATLSTIHYDLSEHDYVETTAPGWLDLAMVRRPPTSSSTRWPACSRSTRRTPICRA